MCDSIAKCKHCDGGYNIVEKPRRKMAFKICEFCGGTGLFKIGLTKSNNDHLIEDKEQIKENDVFAEYSGANDGYYVLLNGERVHFSKERYEADMFMAELKARLKR